MGDFNPINYSAELRAAASGLDKAEIAKIFSDFRVPNSEMRVEYNSNNVAACYRLRQKKNKNIFTEMNKLGSLAVVANCGLLYVSLNGGAPEALVRASAFETMVSSPLYKEISNIHERGHLLHANRTNYERLEHALRSFGQMICLAVNNINNVDAVRSFSALKVFCARKAFYSSSELDQVLLYLKWLTKVSQTVLLKGVFPEMPALIAQEGPFMFEGHLAPFTGELAFISHYFTTNSRRMNRLSYDEAKGCAQIASASRALPYPSPAQVAASVDETISLVIKKNPPNEDALAKYREGLRGLVSLTPAPKNQRTHCSLISKGCAENPRSEGGRSRLLISVARLCTDLPLESAVDLIDYFDQFGNRLVYKKSLDIMTSAIAMRANYYKRAPNLGDILYVKPDEAGDVIARVEICNAVPKMLGKIMSMIASKMMLSKGSYSEPCTIIHGAICFKHTEVTFKLEKPIFVKADVSIEAGMKTRLITAAEAAVAHLGQLPANYMRKYLSQDPFTRVGFEEAEKLWIVLKDYGKRS